MHLAQVNVAYMRAEQNDPLLADFVSELDRINGLADVSPEDREYDDPRVLFNMSVWETVDDLHAFTYKTAHAEIFANRKKWFEEWRLKMQSQGVALWWVPVGHIPTVAEAKEHLVYLTEHGPTARAFTFKRRFDPKGNPIE
jgi:heme-degrading monooxygenase HmoA